MKGAKIPDDFFKDKIDYCGLEDNIYNQLARTMARNADIDFAKTPVVDILTGYTRYIEAEKKVEQLENIRKEAIKIIKKQMPICIMPNNTLIHGAEKAKVLENLLNILNKGSEE